MSPRRNRLFAALVVSLTFAAVSAAPAFAGEKNARLSRFVPKWFKPRTRPAVKPPGPDLHAAPVVEHERAARPLILRGSTEHQNALATITGDAKTKFGKQVPEDVLDRISHEVLDSIWPEEGIAITTYVSILAGSRVQDRVRRYLAEHE